MYKFLILHHVTIFLTNGFLFWRLSYYDKYSYILFRPYKFWILHTMMTVQISWRHEIFNCLNKNTMVMYWLSIDSTWFLKHMLCRDGWYFDFHSDYSVLLNDLRFLLKLYNIWLCIPYSFSDQIYWYKSHVIPHSGTCGMYKVSLNDFNKI